MYTRKKHIPTREKKHTIKRKTRTTFNRRRLTKNNRKLRKTYKNMRGGKYSYNDEFFNHLLHYTNNKDTLINNIKNYKKKNFNINKPDFPPLIAAVKYVNFEVVEALLAQTDIDVNIVNRFNETPLSVIPDIINPTYFVLNEWKKIVNLLLNDSRIDLNKGLIYAVINENPYVVSLLLNRDGIDIEGALNNKYIKPPREDIIALLEKKLEEIKSAKNQETLVEEDATQVLEGEHARQVLEGEVVEGEDATQVLEGEDATQVLEGEHATQVVVE